MIESLDHFGFILFKYNCVKRGVSKQIPNDPNKIIGIERKNSYERKKP